MVISENQLDTADDDASTVYQDSSTNDLTILTSALLLTADCMGTGILALPADVQTLGRGVGLAFLIFNLPVNLYAGTILSWSALYVEEKVLHNSGDSNELEEVALSEDYTTSDDPASNSTNNAHEAMALEWNEGDDAEIEPQNQRRHTDTATFDFVGMTSILFDEAIMQPVHEHFDRDSAEITNGTLTQRVDHHRSISYNHPFTKLVLFIYYLNLFLVLGKQIIANFHCPALLNFMSI